jgi:hypothetical protein
MPDSASRSLLTPSNVGKRTTHKLPLLILSSLSLLLGCIAASIVILLTSHEDSVETWRVRPAVLLSIIAGFYAVLLGGLFTIGVAVTWWRSIIHGTTLTDLYFIDAGASPKDFVPAFIAGGYARRVALVAFVALSAKLATGPMLQRSTRSDNLTVKRVLDMNINLARSIPSGWFGTWESASESGINMSRANMLRNNITSAKTTGYNCPSDGSCDAMVLGAGMNFGCKSKTRRIDLLDSSSANSTLFGIDLVLDQNTSLPILFLESRFVSDISEDCIATLTTETCNMIPAIMWYNVSLYEDVITPNFTAAYLNPAILSNATSPSDEYSDDPKASVGTLKGVERAFVTTYQSGALLTGQEGGSRADYLLNRTAWAPLWVSMFKTETPPGYPESVTQRCPLLWSSPTKMVMERILEFTFRSAIEVAKSDDTYKQPFVALYKGEELQYITDFRWLAVSIAVMALGLAATSILSLGFWELPHYVTLSPLETGKVFGGPIFTGAGVEKEASSIEREVGHERLAFDGDELVWSGSVYTAGVSSSLSKASREPGMEESKPGHSSLKRSNHRKGRISARDISVPQEQMQRPSFEHTLGFTTRRPYEDEEEVDIGRYGRPRSTSHGNDTSPLIPMPLSVSHSTSPGLPPIPPTGRIRMEPSRPCSRMRRGGRCAADAAGMGRRPLGKIDERNTPSPEGPRV